MQDPAAIEDRGILRQTLLFFEYNDLCPKLINSISNNVPLLPIRVETVDDSVLETVRNLLIALNLALLFAVLKS